jgi:CDP-diacylglycerol---glycerol-3-phosphate 3-phosphatidyltransferase
MNWKLPNLLTVGRLGLSLVFFALLANSHVAPSADSGMLMGCFVIYIIAAITDILDGYLARRWRITSAFGRIADPFVDKVMVCGAFALLAGSNFAFPAGGPVGDVERHLPYWLHDGMASAVQAWMVVVLIAREFVISGIRGYSESQGQKFAATWAGKIKMFVQSMAICMILLQLAYLPDTAWAIMAKLALVWLTVLVTVVSGFVYVGRARALLAGDAA